MAVISRLQFFFKYFSWTFSYSKRGRFRPSGRVDKIASCTNVLHTQNTHTFLCCLSCCCVKYSKYKCHSIKIKKPGQSPVRLHTPPTTIISFVKGDYRRQQMEDKSSFDIWNIANDFGPFNLFLFLFFKFFIIIFCYFYELLMWRPAVLFFFKKKSPSHFLSIAAGYTIPIVLAFF